MLGGTQAAKAADMAMVTSGRRLPYNSAYHSWGLAALHITNPRLDWSVGRCSRNHIPVGPNLGRVRARMRQLQKGAQHEQRAT